MQAMVPDHREQRHDRFPRRSHGDPGIIAGIGLVIGQLESQNRLDAGFLGDVLLDLWPGRVERAKRRTGNQENLVVGLIKDSVHVPK